MQKETIKDVRLSEEEEIFSPKELKKLFPIEKNEQNFINSSRHIISNIIHGRDSRLLVICGPCSIHNIDEAIDYAHRLKDLSIELNDYLYIVMRVYFDKPRTTIGWKGLINDPYMDGTFNIREGLKIARNLLLKLIKMNLPLATEVLDVYSPKYIGDMFSWSSIGARTTESQIHREIASGLSTPVGFKNNTDGSIEVAINAIHAASSSHHFIGINQFGTVCLLQTYGNPDGHIILRGGKNPNYYPKDIASCEQKIIKSGLPVALLIDCSHGNSNKNYIRQIDVAESILMQIKSGNRSIIGIMLESYINAGNQSIKLFHKKIQYGISVTDACIDWDSTDKLLRKLHNEIQLIPSRTIRGL